jgi:AsmA protein
MLAPGGFWSGETLRLADLSGADLDLRLSATTARVGALRLEDLAANLLVKPGRLELAIGRATVNRGLVKGRVIVAQAGPTHDLKLQGSFDRLDLGALFADLGQARWITGSAQGQVALDAFGDSPAELARQLQGRAAVTVRQGELWGVALNDALRRAERRPLSTGLEWRGGRTPFEQAQVVANLHDGIGDIVEGHLNAPPTRTALHGRVLVADRSLAVKALVEAVGGAGPASPGPTLAFDISGPWSDISVAPDIPSLIQRSRAARQLLAPEPRGEDAEEPRPGAPPHSE